MYPALQMKKKICSIAGKIVIKICSYDKCDDDPSKIWGLVVILLGANYFRQCTVWLFPASQPPAVSRCQTVWLLCTARLAAVQEISYTAQYIVRDISCTVLYIAQDISCTVQCTGNILYITVQYSVQEIAAALLDQLLAAKKIPDKAEKLPKNPAFGRHWISRRLRIVARIPKKSRILRRTNQLCVICNFSSVTYQISSAHVACCMLLVTCHLSHVTNAKRHSHRPSHC